MSDINNIVFVRDGNAGSADSYLGELNNQLKKLVLSKPGDRSPHMEDEAEDPKSQPIVWVSKWVDYSDKYGFGYSLNDDSIGRLWWFIMRINTIFYYQAWSSMI